MARAIAIGSGEPKQSDNGGGHAKSLSSRPGARHRDPRAQAAATRCCAGLLWHQIQRARAEGETEAVEIVHMTKTATTKKSWRKHPWWRRKPLPDCPLCQGKGL